MKIATKQKSAQRDRLISDEFQERNEICSDLRICSSHVRSYKIIFFLFYSNWILF